MPVQLPDISQNRRVAPTPSGGVASYRGGIAEGAGVEIARSIGDAAQQMSRIGGKLIDVGGDIEYADARSKLLQDKIKADKAFDDDPDYKTYETRYDTMMTEARNNASAGISSASARRRFEVDVDGDIAAGKATLGRTAFAKETDVERAKLNDLIASNQAALLTTTDQSTVNGLIGATNTAIQGAAAKGWVSAVEAGTLGRNFVETSGSLRLKMLPPQQRLAAIMSRASNAPQTPQGITAEPLMPTTVTADIAAAARDAGVDAQTLQRVAELESSGDAAAVNPKNPDAVGLFQITAGTAAQYGLKDRNDPKDSARAAAELMKDNANVLRAKLGRDPTPAELYLAHQQGATGAAALLTHPDQSAVEALTPVYGSAAKAEKRILDNGGTIGMSAASFTNLWAAKFGGMDQAIAASTTQPDGGWMFDKRTGTYLDFVPPDQLEAMRQDALADIDRQESKVQRTNKIAVEAGWDDAKSNALLTGAADESFIAKTAAAYSDDPAVATAKIAELHSYALMGKDSAVLDQMSLDEGDAYVHSLAPQAGPGSALQQVRYENAAQLQAAKEKALKDDPATWVRAKSPEVGDAWDQVAQMMSDPQADPDDARMSARLAVAATTQAEEHQGLTGSDMKILPKDIATQAVDMIRTAKPTEIGGTVDQMMNLYGSRGLQEIVQAGAPTDVFALASANGPEDGPWRSVLVNAMQMKPEDLNKAVKARGIVQTDIDTAFTNSAYNDLIQTLPPSAVPMYTKAISDVMDFQMSAGKSAEDALDFALRPFTNGFAFNGTYRVPLGTGIDPDKVAAGLDGVVANLETMGIQPENSLSGNPAVDPEFEVQQQINSLRQGHYRWITTEEGDGVVMTYDDGSLLGQPVMTEHGPLVVSFAEAQSMKYGRAPTRAPRGIGTKQ